MKNPIVPTRALTFFLGLGCMTLYTGDWHFSAAAWLGPVFILRFLRRSRVPGFALFAAGSVAAAYISQRGMMPFDAPLVFFVSNLLFSVTFLLPFLADRFLYRGGAEFRRTLVYPAALVAVEYFNSRGPYGVWGSLAHSQLALPELLQTASLAGLFGITFLTAWFASTVNWLWERGFEAGGLRKAGAIYGGVLAVLLIYGGARMNFQQYRGETVLAAGITAESDMFEAFASGGRWKDFLSGERDVDRLMEATGKAADSGARIVAWSECALFLESPGVRGSLERFRELAQDKGIYILASFLELSDPGAEKPLRNTNYLIGPDGRILWEYRKRKPVPGGELEFVQPGSSPLPFADTEYGRLGTAICYDADFPDLVRQAGGNGVDILLVPGSDWRGITPFHTNMASMEAVQNGFSLFRVCAHGQTAAFDRHGRVLASKSDFTTGSGILYAEIPRKGRPTPYTRIGGLFPIACVLFLTARALKDGADRARRRWMPRT